MERHDMNSLDSRFIRLGDCFAHRFSTPGTFSYALALLPGALGDHHGDAPAHSVTVSAGDGDQQQHTVTVSRRNGTLAASPAHLKITAGDLVVWAPDRSVTFGFRVRGRVGDDLVDSAALRTESVYTHAFGVPGTYPWADANGSGLRGQVRVAPRDPAAGHEAWLESLHEGTLVHVRGEQAEPAQIDVVVGQTVVWAVQDSPGVSITDASLLPS
jgi:plastocyanin